MYVSFTEEMVMNPAAAPVPGFRYYREEIYGVGDWPIEEGHLWLPPYVDISRIEDLINEAIECES